MRHKWICIVDYNLTRVKDVRLMADYAKTRYGLNTLLIRSKPSLVDRQLADYVIDLDPLRSDFVGLAYEELAPIKDEIVALLPFSDNSVVSGARLAECLKLRADSSELAVRAFSKKAYRQAENSFSEDLKRQNIFSPGMKEIFSVKELRDFLQEHGEMVLKPSCEGNNRGVMRLKKGDDLEAAFTQVQPYLKFGVIAEEVIPFEREFSFDGVGQLAFFTEKLGAMGRYPVEVGQVVPAKLSPSEKASITAAGVWANRLSGQSIGPFHNEIKFDPSTHQAAVVEPNRRPAGMSIWHLAEKVYGISFFQIWIDQLVTGKIQDKLPRPNGVAGIRMLGAGRNGLLKFPTHSLRRTNELLEKIFKDMDSLRSSLEPKIEVVDFQWLAGQGDFVRKTPEDNSQFVASVSLYIADQDHRLAAYLGKLAKVWEMQLFNWIEESTESPKREMAI